MRAIVAAASQRRLGEAAERAIALEASLRSESSPNPEHMGWARFYAFRAAHAAGDHSRAYDLLLSLDEHRHAVGDENRAWMFSVGCELAALQNDIEELETWGERCYAIRRRLGSVDCALRCALLVCSLLARAGALSDYPRWPRRVIGIGKAYGATDVVRVGAAYLEGTRDVSLSARKLRSR